MFYFAYDFMEMKKPDINKKPWVKPEVVQLNIKKDTFSGSAYGNEQAGKSKIPAPWLSQILLCFYSNLKF